MEDFAASSEIVKFNSASLNFLLAKKIIIIISKALYPRYIVNKDLIFLEHTNYIIFLWNMKLEELKNYNKNKF